MTCQECEELAAAYVLDAVTPDEREEIEKHIATCPDCARAVRELRPVADLLPLSVPVVSPSPLAKEYVLANIGADELLHKKLQRERNARRRRGRPWQQQLVAIAAVLVCVVLGSLTAWNISLQQQIASLRSQPAPVNYALNGTASAPGANGQLVYLPKQNITVLTVHGLPQTNGSHVYQGWLLRCKQPTSVGLLTVRDGVATGSFQGDVRGYDNAAVSLEPGPAASQNAPRGAVVALGVLTAPSPSTSCS